MSWMFAVGCGGGDDDDTVTDAGGKDGTAPTLDATSGDDDATTPADAAADTGILGTDSGVKDAAADSTVPPGSDAGDAGEDAGDAGDAGHDAGVDSGVDAGTLPLFNTVGRWSSPTATTMSAAWPGSGLTVTFTGPTLELSITDAPRNPAATMTSNNVSGASGADYLEVYIDDTPTAHTTPTAVPIAIGGAKTVIYSSPGSTATHTAKIYKATDADIGTITVTLSAAGNVVGTPFTVANTFGVVPAASPFTTKIEFIGDEQTAGWGDGTTCTTDADGNYVSTDNNENAAVPGLVAEYFNAARVTTANFQLGLDANAYFAGDDLVSNYYPRTLPYTDTTATWNFATFVPQAVVVNLGSMTDFVVDPAGPFTTFTTDLTTFLKQVYTQYTVNGKGPYIAVVTGPEYGGTYTAAEETAFQTATANAVTAYKAAIAGATGSAIVAPTYSSSCGGFPDATANAATAKAIEDAIGATLGKAGP
jgi:lysophospholipase L1-like esterase